MVDGEGAIRDADETARTTAIENHHQWVDAAKFLARESSGKLVLLNVGPPSPDFLGQQLKRKVVEDEIPGEP